ncbi:MAG TPA: SDR family oxidoreductase [Nocardioidaceae bacterium]|nr:SDR family oxidoreductase [Nocardioidaceae bacterium]
MEIDDAAAVVTGGGDGLGSVLSLRLASLGAHVVVADIDGDAASRTVADIHAAGGKASPAELDVRDDAAVAALVEEAAAATPGGLRVWVNNAGGWTPGVDQFPDAIASDWSRTLDLNLRAPMIAIQAARERLRDNGGGVVVNVASIAGSGSGAYGSPEYAAAKAGLIRLTSALGGLAASDGIRVNCIVPDWIGLPRAYDELAQMTDAERAAIPPLIPPDQVADVVVGLIVDDRAVGRAVVLQKSRPRT